MGLFFREASSSSLEGQEGVTKEAEFCWKPTSDHNNVCRSYAVSFCPRASLSARGGVVASIQFIAFSWVACLTKEVMEKREAFK